MSNPTPSVSITLAEVEADILGEQKRHADRMAQLVGLRDYVREKLGIAPDADSTPSPAPTPERRTASPYPRLDPTEYGGKKKLALRILEREGSLSIFDLLAAVRKAGWDVSVTSLQPQLSAWKNVDKVVDSVDGQWTINDRGKGYLREKN